MTEPLDLDHVPLDVHIRVLEERDALRAENARLRVAIEEQITYHAMARIPNTGQIKMLKAALEGR